MQTNTRRPDRRERATWERWGTRANWRAWVEDDARPGGVGRAERERIFWERVASGGARIARPERIRRTGPRETAAATPDRSRTEPEPESQGEGAREGLEMAVVTLLTVVVFGLGWATLESEGVVGAGSATGYDAGRAHADAASEPRSHGVGLPIETEAMKGELGGTSDWSSGARTRSFPSGPVAP